MDKSKLAGLNLCQHLSQFTNPVGAFLVRLYFFRSHRKINSYTIRDICAPIL